MMQRAMWKRQCMGLLLVCFVFLAGCHSEEKGGGTKPGGQSKQGGGGEKGGGGSKQSGSDSKSGGSDSSGSAGGSGKQGGSGQQGGEGVSSDTVKIKQEDQHRAGIRVDAVQVRTMPRQLSVAGQVTMDEKHTDHIGTLADGRIDRVNVLPGDRVRRGQTLATLHSHLIHETVAALLQSYAALRRAESAVNFTTQARDRYVKLYSIQAASLEERQRSEQELAQAQKDRADAQPNVHAEREHLSELLQVNPEMIVQETLYKWEMVPVRAVADGVVIMRNVTPGQVVTLGYEAFVISNLSTVWVSAAVNDKDLPGVRVGATAQVMTRNQGDQGPGVQAQAPPGQQQGMPGRVGMLGDVVDPQNRTLPVRIVVPNPGTRLRPGMFATALIDESATRTAIFVPSDALQDVNGFRVVFVTPDGVTFQARTVKTGPEVKGMTEVVEGLQPTDHVVVSGAFMVKGELLKGSVGEG